MSQSIADDVTNAMRDATIVTRVHEKRYLTRICPHSTRRRSMAICAIWKSATDRIGLGWFGGSDTITTN